jgi:hypothetical protein
MDFELVVRSLIIANVVSSAFYLRQYVPPAVYAEAFKQYELHGGNV